MGNILVIAGLSANGKDKLAEGILREMAPNARMVVSNTTRMPRDSDNLPGEYRYITSGASFFGDKKKFLWVKDFGGNTYGTLKESVTEILDSENTLGIMILIPDVHPILDDFVFEHTGKNDLITYVFIQPLPMQIVRERLKDKPKRYEEVCRRHKEEAKWETMVLDSALPFHFISNEGPPEEALQEVLRLLREQD